MKNNLKTMKPKCDISKCKGTCCGSVPIPKQYFTALKNRIVRPIIRFEDAGNLPELGGHNVVAITNEDIAENRCPFQRYDYKCNIYERRPKVCRMFGEGKHKYLQCGYLGQKMPSIGEILTDIDSVNEMFKLIEK